MASFLSLATLSTLQFKKVEKVKTLHFYCSALKYPFVFICTLIKNGFFSLVIFSKLMGVCTHLQDEWKRADIGGNWVWTCTYFSYKLIERNKKPKVKTPAINWWRGKQIVRDCRLKRGKVRGSTYLYILLKKVRELDFLSIVFSS